MGDIAGLKFEKLRLTKDGSIAPGAVATYPTAVTDLIVISHGWHVDPAEADAGYRKLIEHLVAEAGGEWTRAGRVFGVLGIFWPSDKFRDDLSAETFVGTPVAGARAAAADDSAGTTELEARAVDLAAFLEIEDVSAFLKRVRRAAKGDGKDGDAAALVAELRARVSGDADADAYRDHEELLNCDPTEMVAQLALQGNPAPPPNTTSIAAAATGGGGNTATRLFTGTRAGVARLLNQFAYYEMKKRAGIVGAALGKRLAVELPGEKPRLHLVGHSFGARLVTAATAEMESRKPASLTLLQAAFSHNSFGVDISYLFQKFDGGFRKVVGKWLVDGPITITHTWNDHAVGLAYPAASRISQTVAAGIGVTPGFGGEKDIFGGMGANGALRLRSDEGTFATFDGTEPLALPAQHVTSLHCDFIADHNDVERIEVARLLQAAFR